MVESSTPPKKIQNLRNFTVQIRHIQQTETIVGTGFVISADGLIATCAHVVVAAGVNPRFGRIPSQWELIRQSFFSSGDALQTNRTAAVTVYFPQARLPQERMQPAIVVGYFQDSDDDVVLLKLQADRLPEGVGVAIVDSANDSVNVAGDRKFRSYGYRRLGNYQGLQADGVILGTVEPPAGRTLLKDPLLLQSPEIDSGMSGAAVLDVVRDRVVGIISETSDVHSGSDRDTSFAVDIAVLQFLPSSGLSGFNDLVAINSPERQTSTVAETAARQTSTVPETSTSRTFFPRLQTGAVSKNASTDQPITSLKEDKLGFSLYARAFRDLIASDDTTTPLTIGIDSPWGTGKTSLMRMIQDELDPKRSFWQWFWHSLFSLLTWLFWFTKSLPIGRKIWRRCQNFRRYDERLQPKFWIWLKWLIPFSLTFPMWFLGRVILFIHDSVQFLTDGTSENKRANQEASFVRTVRQGLSHQSLLDQNRISDENEIQKPFWRKIAVWHYPISSPTHPTIWFNAWKFDQEEQLWAALALTVLKGIRKRHGPVGRLFLWISLTFRRFSIINAFLAIIWKWALPILLGLAAWKYDYFIKQMVQSKATNLKDLLPLGEPLLWAGAIIFTLDKARNIIKDPFQISLKQVFDKPDYAEKIGFIGSFEEDFSRIIAASTQNLPGLKPQKLVVFIDDLDRCELPKAVDIVEAINLFLDSERCVFVLGMDSKAVVASIETKYKDLFQKIQQETIGLVSPGRLFLDKIIQLPFSVPSPTLTKISGLVESIISTPYVGIDSLALPVVLAPNLKELEDTKKQEHESIGENKPTSNPIIISYQDLQQDTASYAHEDVRSAIRLGTSFLKPNPRQIKRFINLFRFYVYLIDGLGFFEYIVEEDRQVGLTLDKLAVWIAWLIRWPEISRCFFEEIQLLELRRYLLNLSFLLTEQDGQWISQEVAQEMLVSQKLEESFEEIIGNISKAKNLTLYQSLIQNIEQNRESRQNSKSHWCHLPWEWWLRDSSLLQCIKELEFFWQDASTERDWLKTLLTMTHVSIDLQKSFKEASLKVPLTQSDHPVPTT